VNQNRSRGALSSLVIGVIVFAAYCLVVFLVFQVKNPTVFWMSFAFMCLAFLAQALAPVLFFKNVSADTAFFGIPILYLGTFYFFAELFASIVFMIFQSVDWKAALLVQVALLVIFVVAAIISITTQVSVQQASEDRRNEAVIFKALLVDIQTLVDRCASETDGDLRKRLQHLSETVRYSDPFGRNETVIRDVEMQISQKMSDLQVYCDSGATAKAETAVAELENLYMERRRKLMLVK
jgi:hypothetical protein